MKTELTSKALLLWFFLLGLFYMALQLATLPLGINIFAGVGVNSLVVIITTSYICQLQNRSVTDCMSASLPSTHNLVISALLAVSALVPASFLSELSSIIKAVPDIFLHMMADNMPTSTVEIIIAFLAVGVAVPFVEELLFRGFLQRALKKHWGSWPAIIISALVFGIIHLEPWYLFGLVGVGVLLGYIYDKTGSILASTVTHGAFNTISFAMMLSTDPFAPTGQYHWWDFALLGVSVVAMVKLVSMIQNQAKQD